LSSFLASICGKYFDFLFEPIFFHIPIGKAISKVNGNNWSEIDANAWHAAAREARFVGKLLHDNRRTAVRSMSRTGIPDTVAMKIPGHKTRSVFDRYNITSEEDLRSAVEKISQSFQDKQQVVG